MQSYTVRVVSSNYDEFAILFFKKLFKNREYFKMTLYGRSSPTASATGSCSRWERRGPSHPAPRVPLTLSPWEVGERSFCWSVPTTPS